MTNPIDNVAKTFAENADVKSLKATMDKNEKLREFDKVVQDLDNNPVRQLEFLALEFALATRRFFIVGGITNREEKFKVANALIGDMGAKIRAFATK